jgi:hypothetical protein
MKQINFETIGSASQELRASNSTGLQRGEIGADLQKTAAARLATQTPTETNRSLEAALMQRYGLSKRLRASVMAGEPDYAMVPVRDDPDFQAAYNAAQLAMVPAPDEMIIAAIGVLEAKCKRGKESDGAGDLGLRVFVSELRKYPADVVLTVLSDWGNENIFAPSWHELKVKLDKATQKRRDLLVSLEWSSKQPTTALLPKPAPERPVDFDTAPVLSVDPAPPVRSAQSMAEALRGMGEG